MGGVTLSLNVITMILGYSLANISHLDQPSSKSIAVEVGIQNGTLGITIATVLLNAPTMAIPSAIYSLIMFANSAIFGWVLINMPSKLPFLSTRG